MFKTLLYKDYLLLRVCLRISLLSSVLMYPVGFVLVYWFTETYMDESKQQPISQLLLTLSGVSGYGMVLTCLFSAIIAASTIASERSDRSSEFLACLPPTRWQSLQSKLLLLTFAVVFMLVVHNGAAYIAWNLTAYAKSSGIEISFFGSLVVSCVVLCITGFAFAGSSLMHSNGGPALIGLLSPLLSVSIVMGIGQLMDLPMEGDMFAIRYSVASATLGIAMLFCGSLWYLNGSEA